MWLHYHVAPTPDGIAIYARDITGRKQAEELLQKMRAAVEASIDGISILSEDGTFQYVNRAQVQLHGYGSAQELLGKDWSVLYGGEEIRRLKEEIAPSLARTGEWRGETAGTRSDGSIFPQEVSLTRIDGVGFVCIDWDITERKRVEQALRDSEERFRALTEHSSDVVTLLDLEGVIRYQSASIERVLGYPGDEMLGRNVLHLIHTEDLPKVMEAFHRLAYAPESVHRVEFRFPHRDGSWRVLEARGSNRLHDPMIAGIIVSLRDITQRRQAEVALRESHGLLNSIIESTPDTIFVKDLEGRYLLVNSAGARMIGRTPDEVAGKDDEALVPPEIARSFREADQRVIRTGEMVATEQTVPTGTGVRTFSVMEVPHRDHRGEVAGVLGIARDITGIRQVAEALREAKEEAERANRAKSEFLSRMSHELRTPLNAILGFGQLLEADVARPDDRESVEQILHAGRHLLGLINEVLDVARIEAGRVSLSLEPVEVREVLRQALALVRPLAAGHGVSLRAAQALSCRAYARADLQRLKQVLLNLLSNAIKYNHPGGSVALSCEEGGGRVRLAVTDTGPGIPPEKQERLFTPFERLGAEQGQVEGTGLGLALSKGLTQLMGGRVGVSSVPGEGSTFWVEFPLAEGPDPAGEDPETEIGTQAMVPPVHTVLLVEDNPANIRLVERILSRRPRIRLLPVMQGRRGLEMAHEERPALILLDLNLPDVSGEEVLRELQADPGLCDVPVVVVSADAMPSQIGRLLAAGASAYLTKPLDMKECLRVVDEILKERGE